MTFEIALETTQERHERDRDAWFDQMASDWDEGYDEAIAHKFPKHNEYPYRVGYAEGLKASYQQKIHPGELAEF